MNPAKAVGEVLVVDLPDLFEMVVQALAASVGEESRSIQEPGGLGSRCGRMGDDGHGVNRE